MEDRRFMHMDRYRADVDGLRAVAIVPVLLYHADFAGFRAGFVGVDIYNRRSHAITRAPDLRLRTYTLQSSA